MMTPFLFRGSNLNADFDSYGCLVANAWTMEVRPSTSSHSPSFYLLWIWIPLLFLEPELGRHVTFFVSYEISTQLEKKPQADKSSSSCSTISKEELTVIDLTAHMLYVHAKKGEIFDSERSA